MSLMMLIDAGSETEINFSIHSRRVHRLFLIDFALGWLSLVHSMKGFAFQERFLLFIIF